MYGLKVKIINRPIAAAEQDKIRVRKLPERMKAIIKKVTKKTQAVPKSFIRKSDPMQIMEKTINPERLFVVCSSSRVAVPTKMKAIFMNSDG